MPGGRKRYDRCPSCGAQSWATSPTTGRRWCRPCNIRRSSTVNRKRRLDWARPLWDGARNRAKASGATFTITLDDVRAAIPEDRKCPALGIPLERGTKKRPGPRSPTLDRLNNDWGYEPGNIAVISYAANRAKGNLRAQDLEAIAAWMRRQGLD